MDFLRYLTKSNINEKNKELNQFQKDLLIQKGLISGWIFIDS